MPGLIRGAARTAVVAGTATAVSNRVTRRQAERWAGVRHDDAPPQRDAPAPEAAAPAAAPEDPVIARLKELAALRDQGVLTDAEFAAAKAKLLT